MATVSICCVSRTGAPSLQQPFVTQSCSQSSLVTLQAVKLCFVTLCVTCLKTLVLQENRKKNVMSSVLFLLSGLVKLWSALTLQGSYQNRRCAFRVLQVMGPPPITAVLFVALTFLPFLIVSSYLV